MDKAAFGHSSAQAFGRGHVKPFKKGAQAAMIQSQARVRSSTEEAWEMRMSGEARKPPGATAGTQRIQKIQGEHGCSLCHLAGRRSFADQTGAGAKCVECAG